MQEHPVPQNVTGYEFHLIGQMTLKQFMELAAGVLAAVLINTTNLPGVFKIPLMVIAVLLGAALAFVPLEGRPLDRWFFAFIKSIYQPTMFFWKKTTNKPAAFDYIQPTNIDTSPTVNYTPLRQSRVSEFLETIPASGKTPTDEEDVRAEAILQLFNNPNAPLPTSAPKIQVQQVSTQQPKVNVESQVNVSVLPEKNEPVVLSPSPIPTSTIKQKVTPISGGLTEVFSQEESQPMQKSQPVTTSDDLPFPSTPTIPNMIVGMIISQENKIIDNAIVTIFRKNDGTPVRALKSNLLGQFAIVTPLEDGEYILSVEKDGFQFENATLSLHNQIIAPIRIQAKPTGNI